jgi:hypothetical protein
VAHTLKQLGQQRPNTTAAVSIYNPPVGNSVVHSIIICNTTTSAAKYRIFCDDDGTTYDETTALFYDVSLPAKTTDTLEVKICMNDATGNLAVSTDTANALTFTLFGEEIT